MQAEKNYDHSALIIEVSRSRAHPSIPNRSCNPEQLYTQALDVFKRHKVGQDRTSRLIATRIADTYRESNNWKLALQFYTRVVSLTRGIQGIGTS